MEGTISLKRVLFSITIWILLFLSQAVEADCQFVIHLKGPIDGPPGLKRDAKVPAGQVISTGDRGRVVLEYRNIPPSRSGRAAHGYVIINAREKYKVPEQFPPAAQKGVSADLHKKTTGIGAVIFYGLPGASGSHVGLGYFREDPLLIQREFRAWEEFHQSLDSSPETFSGELISVDEKTLSVKDEGVTHLFQITQETRLAGVKAISELREQEVWIEYVVRVHQEPAKPPSRTREILSIMRTQSEAFYVYLGFEERGPYAGNCESLPVSESCLKFDDGYVWLVRDTIKERSKLDVSRHVIVEERIGTNGEYHHILGTSFIRKITQDSAK